MNILALWIVVGFFIVCGIGLLVGGGVLTSQSNQNFSGDDYDPIEYSTQKTTSYIFYSIGSVFLAIGLVGSILVARSQ